MNENNVPAAELSVNEIETTGLPCPKSWTGVYLFVIFSFIFWLAVLIVLTEIFA